MQRGPMLRTTHFRETNVSDKVKEVIDIVRMAEV